MISGNLFTRDYLLEGIERTPQWKAIGASEFSELQERLSHIAHGFLKIAKPNEAETEKEFIYPVRADAALARRRTCRRGSEAARDA